MAGGLGETLDANFGQKKILSIKKFFWESKPGQIDAFHEMRWFSLSIHIRKISNLTTEIVLDTSRFDKDRG